MSLSKLKDFAYATPESLGIPSSAITAFLHGMKENGIEMHGFALMRHDKIAASCEWDPYVSNAPHIMFSFSKSLTSTAVGFARQEGLLTLDEKLVDIFPDLVPENPSENLKKMDIFSLLTMTCGHAEEISTVEHDPDWLRRFMAHEVKYEPGTTYQYNTAGTTVLTAIVQKKTGMKMTEYLRTRLFEPTGMNLVPCYTLPDGTEFGGAGMYLTQDDMVRFGRFLLNRGMWNGKRLLEENWFDLASTKQVGNVSEVYHSESPDWRQGYGFQFWMCQPENTFRADGAYGQFAIISKDKDFFVTISSAEHNTQTMLTVLWETIFAEVQENPLPENPEAFHELQDFMKNASLPALFNVRDNTFEALISNNVYMALEETPSLSYMIGGSGFFSQKIYELQSLKFEFTKNALKLQVNGTGAKETLLAPLDGQWITEEFAGRKLGVTSCWNRFHTLDIIVRDVTLATGALLSFEFDGEDLTLRKFSTHRMEQGLGDTGLFTVKFTR